MEEEEIKKGNKLIAEFMGFIERKPDEEFSTTWFIKGGFAQYGINELKYNISWDWLMPVVEKINSINNREYDVIIWRSDCHINDRLSIIVESSIFKGNYTLIQIVWLCVVEFINVLNQPSPPKP